MGSLLGPIGIGSRLVYEWPRDLASRRSAHDSPVAILCDNVPGKPSDFSAIDSKRYGGRADFKSVRAPVEGLVRTVDEMLSAVRQICKPVSSFQFPVSSFQRLLAPTNHKHRPVAPSPSRSVKT